MNANQQQDILASFDWQSLLGDSIIGVDRQGLVVYASQQVQDLFGNYFPSVQGRKITDILPESKVLQVLTTGEPVICTETEPRGERLIVHYFPWLSDGSQIGALAFFRRPESIAGVREELAAHRLVNSMYEAILEELAVGLIVVNTEGKIVFVNRAASERLRPGTGVSLLLRDLTRLYPKLEVRQVLASGVESELKLLELAGEEVFASVVPLYHEHERLGAVVKLFAQEKIDTREVVEQLKLLNSRLNLCKRELDISSVESPFWSVIGEDPGMKKVKRLAERVAKGDATVLLTGESGTGKGVFAQAIHRSSPRTGHPFVQINCAAIPENLLESELFGYEEGAFTGAAKGGRIGKLEMANHGTLFLDEIGDMPLAMQAKILRVLQDRTFEKVGGTKTVAVDVRIIAATNKELQALIETKEFRLDLFYRLSVIKIPLPPLRERGRDILLLASRVIENLNVKYGMNVEGVAPEVEKLFLEHAWPGNVRHLENVLEYAFNMIGDEQSVITCGELPEEFQRCAQVPSVWLDNVVAQAEKEAILKALSQTKGRKKEAAALLGIPRSSLYEKVKKYGIKG